MNGRRAGVRGQTDVRGRALLACVLLAGALAGSASPLAAQGLERTHARDVVASAAVSRTIAPAVVSPPADAWWGEDKVRHFAASAAITAIGYGGARVALEPDASVGVAIGAAAVAGLLREVHDHRRGGPFSLRDLLWDALGIVAGTLWIREIE